MVAPEKFAPPSLPSPRNPGSGEEWVQAAQQPEAGNRGKMRPAGWVNRGFFRTTEENLNPRKTPGDFPGPWRFQGMVIPTPPVQNNLFAW